MSESSSAESTHFVQQVAEMTTTIPETWMAVTHSMGWELYALLQLQFPRPYPYYV